MNPNLEHAIIEFLANEFHLQPEDLIADTDFRTDLNLDEEQFSQLLTRIQDALEFVLPEEKMVEIHTVGDLLNSLHLDDPDPTL